MFGGREKLEMILIPSPLFWISFYSQAAGSQHPEQPAAAIRRQKVRPSYL